MKILVWAHHRFGSPFSRGGNLAPPPKKTAWNSRDMDEENSGPSVQFMLKKDTLTCHPRVHKVIIIFTLIVLLCGFIALPAERCVATIILERSLLVSDLKGNYGAEGVRRALMYLHGEGFPLSEGIPTAPSPREKWLKLGSKCLAWLRRKNPRRIWGLTRGYVDIGSIGAPYFPSNPDFPPPKP